MGTKTIGLHEDVYERLKARKRDDESFTDLVDRLLTEATADWQEGYGTLPDEEAEKLERIVADSRRQLGAGLSERQMDALDEMAGAEDDEAA